MITGWYFAFTKPWLHPHGLFGHVEAYGCDEDGSWVFVDPRSTGLQITCFFRYEDVEDVLTMMNERADLILWMPKPLLPFKFPIHGLMTCASICGSLVNQRALFPRTLRRKLLAKGAEVVHGQDPEGKSRRSEGTAA